MQTSLLDRLERLVRSDPARRGLISTEPDYGPLCAGHAQRAAAHLAAHAKRVGIATGFFVPGASVPAAETDGPPGAVLLASVLIELGVEVVLLTDAPCGPALQAAARAARVECEVSIVEGADTAEAEELVAGESDPVTHLIAVERVGPSHTFRSLLAQARYTHAPVDDFETRVPDASRDRCHNARGQVIDEHTAPLHRLFEVVRERCPGVRTVGVGDGGNEIGMGAIPWEDLARRLPDESAARIPCRVATDWTVVAGTSNWGAWSLAASLAVTHEDRGLLAGWDGERQRELLEQMVRRGPAVDGITGRAEATVDGLPFATYVQPWGAIRRTLGLD